MSFYRQLTAGALFFIHAVFATNLFAAGRPPVPTTPVKMNVPVGETTVINLRSVLTSPFAETIKWQRAMPPGTSPWAVVDDAAQTLSVTPPVGGKTNILISAETLTNVDPGTEPTATILFEFNASRPAVWGNTNLGKWDEGKPFSVDLTTLATHADGEKINFSIEYTGSNANWITLSTDKLVGNPIRKDVGAFSLTLVATTAVNGLVTKKVATGEVLKVIKPPAFTTNPIILPDAIEDSSYAQSIFTSALVSNPEGQPVTFTVKSGQPSWLTFKSDGSLSGNPVRKDGGAVLLVVTLSSVIDGKTYSAETTVKFNVKLINKPPEWSKDPIVLADAPVKKLVTANLAAFASDIDGNTLTYKKISGPAWADVSTVGLFSGTPQNSDIGPWEFVVEVTDGEFKVNTRVQVKVFNTPPKWSANPLVLKNAKEDENYIEALKTYVTDVDGDALTFEKLDGPIWMTIKSDGSISGVPARGDLGPNSFKVKVTDNVSGSAETVVQVTVTPINKPPYWTRNPIELTEAFERSAYSDTVAPFATDPDLSLGDVLSFEKVSSTSPWVSISDKGVVTGTPVRASVGTTTMVVRVKDKEGKSATATVTIKVNKVNRPPVWVNNPIQLPNAIEDSAFAFDIASQVTDADGDALTFTMISGPGWLTSSTTGKLAGTPKEADITPSYTAQFDVFDGEATVRVDAIGKVLKANKRPVWSQDPITLPNGRAEEPYQQDLAGFASDPDGDTLTYRKLTGPGWANIAGNGLVSGTPKRGDVGPNTFTVEVSDGKLTANVTVKIQVDKAFEPPKWAQDPLILPDALEGSPFAFDLLPLVTDPDGDKLTFSLVTGPAWLTLSGPGQLSGVPQRPDVKSYTAVFEVTDGKFKVTVGALGRVLPRNDPPIINQNALSFVVKERQTLAVNLADPMYIKDPDGDALTFDLIDKKDWVVITTVGRMTLSPKHKDVGAYALNFTVKDAKNLAVPGVLNIQVQPDPKAPTWKEDPIRFVTKAGVPFSNTLAGRVTDIDGVPLTFSGKSGPTWLTIAANGALSGTPTESEVGDNNFIVTARNETLGSDVTVIITVKSANTPPAWSRNPIVLPDAIVGQAYNQSIAAFASDADGDPIKFSKVDGSTWAYLTSAGLFIGVPETANIGVNEFTVRVTDNKGAFADAKVLIRVRTGNQPPIWSQGPINLGDAYVREAFNFNLAALVRDPEGDALTFKKISGPSWLSVSSGGQIFGVPEEIHLGAYTAVFEVSDASSSVQVDAFGQVIKRPAQGPTWKENPIRFTAKQDVLFTNTLVDKVLNPAPGTTLVFSKVGGRPWLTVASTGGLSGTPSKDDIGANNFVVSVTNGQGSANVDVIIDVLKSEGPGSDSIRIDDVVPGARVDNLWVIDNSPTCKGSGCCLIHDLQKDIDVYFRALDKAGVHHLAIYMSSDACKYAMPIKDKSGRLLISWEDTDGADSFNSRLARSPGLAIYNSPLVQMVRFFRDVPGMSGIGSFFEKDVPLDTMVVTAHSDQYRDWQPAGTLTAGWNVSDYVKYYQSKASAQNKAHRTSAIAPRCPTLAFPSDYHENDSCTKDYARGENPYQQLVRETGGTFYTYHSRTSVRDALEDYADKVIFGAMVRAHKRIHLSGTPSNPALIEVKLAGTVILGNTGSATDKWTYDRATNDIIIHWDRIDMTTLKPGDRIEISYPRSVSVTAR